MKQNGFYIDLITPENKERNSIIQNIVNRYEKRVRMGKETLILFCIVMFCAGAEYQQHVINEELKGECQSRAIGNWFVTSMDHAFKEADIVCFADDFKLLFEIGKESYNDGINYVYDIFHDVILEVYDMQNML